MKVIPRNIESFLKTPGAGTRAVLVYGPDEGLVRERAALLAKTVVADINDPFNVVEIPNASLLENPSRLMDEAKAISMLGGRRVVRVQGAADTVCATIKETLSALQDGDGFVLVAAGDLPARSALRLLFEGAENAAALPCYKEDERDLARVISADLKERGYAISSDALAYMTQNVVGDRAVARSETEKLAVYMGTASKNISLDDVSAAIGSSAGLSLDDLAKNTASGLFTEAERILSHVLAEGLPAVTVLRTLQNYFMRLHLVRARMEKGETAEAAMAKLRPPIFWKHKAAFENQISRFSMAQIEQALSAIISAEARCKQTGSMPETVSSRLVLSLCQMSSRAGARQRA